MTPHSVSRALLRYEVIPLACALNCAIRRRRRPRCWTGDATVLGEPLATGNSWNRGLDLDLESSFVFIWFHVRSFRMQSVNPPLRAFHVCDTDLSLFLSLEQLVDSIVHYSRESLGSLEPTSQRPRLRARMET